MSEPDLTTAYYRLIYYPTYSRLDGLTIGVSIALIRTYSSNSWAILSRRGDIVALIGALVVAAALYLFEDKYSLYTVIAGFPLLALGFGLLVVSAANTSSILGTI